MQQKPVSSSSENFPRTENVEKPAKTKTLAECYEPHSPVDKAMREASRSSDLNSLSNAPIGENRANGVRVFDGKRAASLMDGSSVDGGDDMGMTLTEFSVGKNVGSQLLGDLGGDGINKNSEMCVANVVPVDNLSGATRDCLSGKVDSEHDGDDSFSGKDGAAGENLISGGERDDELKIEFKTGRNLNEKVSKNDSNVDPDEKIVDICSSAPKRLKNRVLTGRKEETKELNAGQNVWEMEDGHGGHGDTKFAVGDFVWGKIKSHPWWPGRIFDPSNASEFAFTYKHEGRLLVAYFGDGTFAWCKSQQLKSFAENFEEMSKQSSSKGFVNAVENAVDEFSRLVVLDITCSCMPKGTDTSRPLVINAGIKEGVNVPEGGIGKFSIAHVQPAEILSNLGNIACSVSLPTLLQLTVYKNWFSTFYRPNGCSPLQDYYDSMENGYLEDNVEALMEGSVRGPVEEYCSLGMGANKDVPGTSENNLLKKRKEKSIAELLGTDMDFEKKIGDEEGIVKVDGQSGKLYSESRKRRRIVTEDQTPPDDNLNTHMERRKSTRFPRSAAAAKKRVLNSDEDGGALKQQNSLPWKPKQSSNPEVENGAVAGEGTVKISHPRERRKSKYLSPPYTNPEQQKERERSRRGSQEAAALESSCTSSPEQRQRESSKKRSEAAAMEFSDVARMQQSMEKAAGPHIGSVGKRDPRTNVDRPLESMTSPSEILTEIPSSDLDTIKGFISSYRNSKYQNESNDHLPGKNKADRAQWKRNSSVPFCGSEAQDPKARCRMDKKDEEEKLGLNRDSEVGEGKNSPALLLLTFPPRFSLPSKNDLTKIYRKFGALDETKTEVLQKSSTAKIFFAKSSDAEAAMSSSQQSSPFGVAKVSYTVQGFITMPEINKANENTCPKASSKFRKKSRYSANQSGLGSSEIKQNNKESGSVAADGGASELAFLREKLEAMASILGENDGAMSLEIKSNLERGMKELLGKVRRMTASSSSVAS